MEIKFYNTPDPQNLTEFPEAPAFLSYIPDFEKIKKTADQFTDKKNLVIIAHGGSITSFYGIYNALLEKSTKKVYFVSTVDPDYISEVKAQVNVEDTLVIAISKSGETITQIEALLQFLDYELLFITGSMGPLANMATKLNARLLLHPPIGGRFTGITEVALVPSAICSLDVKAIYNGAKLFYQQYQTPNIASDCASSLFQLEQKGFVDVYVPFYDHHLYPFSNLVIQLCHESFGKKGKGQTYFSAEGPETQHHTNQRFFGGQKNIAGWFVGVDKSLLQTVTEVPDEISSITLKESTFKILNKISLHDALNFERTATIEDARLKNIPVIEQNLKIRDESEIGSFIAFWQMYAVYSSLWRNVNPFDQPEVEDSKIISFNKRLGKNGQL